LFASYRVDKQTNKQKQSPLKASNALRYATTLAKDGIYEHNITEGGSSKRKLRHRPADEGS